MSDYNPGVFPGQSIGEPGVQPVAAQLRSGVDRQHQADVAPPLPALFDGLAEGVAQLDSHWRYTYVNEAARALTGSSREDLLGCSLWEVFPDLLGTGFETKARQAMAEQRPATLEFCHPGLGRWYEHRFHPAPSGLLFFTLDIDRRKRLDTQVHDLERQLMLLSDASAALLASPHSAQVLHTILDLAQRFVAADAYAVWRMHEGGMWRLVSAAGLSAEFVNTGEIGAKSTQPLPDGAILIEDIAAEPLLQQRNASLVREGVRSMMLVPLTIHGIFSGTVVFYWRAPHTFAAAEARIATSLGNLAASALGTAELYERQMQLRGEAQASERSAAFLAESGAVLASSLDYEATLASVANLAVPAVADWAAVDVLDAAGVLKRVAITHSDPEKIRLAIDFAQRYPPREDDMGQLALRSGKSILMAEIPDALVRERARDPEHLRMILELGIKSLIVAPMVVERRSLGLIIFVTAESGRRYTASDLRTAEELARRAATALENARLYRESRQSQEELRLINGELRRANEDLNQFAYSASHDLQEPLRAVAIYSQLLEQRHKGKLDETSEKYLGFLLQGARRMEALLRDILAYTRAANTAEQAPGPVDASAVLQKVLVNLQNSLAETGASVEYGGLPRVRVLDVHLLQLFQNLIGNALKYRAAQAPRIRVSAVPDGARWRFSVEDNGIGFDPKYGEQVFGLFKRLHTAEEYPGTGVGLAICQKIVERYGGRIWAESQPGSGASFFFTLPADEPAGGP